MDKFARPLGAAKGFLSSKYFDSRYKTKVHMTQILFVITMFALTGARLTFVPKGVKVTRSDTLGVVMGIKTLAVLLYQISTSHVARLKKWASLKAYTILNFTEILFWFVVVIITIMSMSRSCQGPRCGLGLGVTLVAIFLCVFALWTAIVSLQLYREAKRCRSKRHPAEVADPIDKSTAQQVYREVV